MTALQQQAGQFLTNRAQEIDALKARGQDPTLPQAQREQATAAALTLESQWGPSGAIVVCCRPCQPALRAM